VAGPEDALRQAQQLIDGGSPFYAHEVLEEVWKATVGPQRELWRGLAQLAVGLTHAHRGNRKGAVALLRRGADRIEPYSGESPYRLDVAGLVRRARWLAARIDQEGIPSAGLLHLQLRR
jgi:predicted metal-dependent hydrolase